VYSGIVCSCCLLLFRLVFLLQLMGTFVEVSCSKMGVTSASSTTNTSVGPIVKKYWSRTLQLCSTLTQTMSQVRSVCGVAVMMLQSRFLLFLAFPLTVPPGTISSVPSSMGEEVTSEAREVCSYIGWNVSA